MLDGIADTTRVVLYDATTGHPILRSIVSSLGPILMIPFVVFLIGELRRRHGEAAVLSVVSIWFPLMIGAFALVFVVAGTWDAILFQRAIAEGRFRVTEGAIESVRRDRSGRKVDDFAVKGRNFLVHSNTSDVGYDGGGSEKQLHVGRYVRVHDIRGRIFRLEVLQVPSEHLIPSRVP